MGVFSWGKFIKLHIYNSWPLICVCYTSIKSSKNEARQTGRDLIGLFQVLSSTLLVPLPQEPGTFLFCVSTFDYLTMHHKSHTASWPCPHCCVPYSLLPRSHASQQSLSESAPHSNSLLQPLPVNTWVYMDNIIGTGRENMCLLLLYLAWCLRCHRRSPT